ncbi:MAG TPA: anthranilate phosphoribosyltransferase [Candidatus Eisenbacteria bacterium]|nr:anthranilate phosphoribosyltransferase [Candidatus Eisenbacteria bacterium]
MSALLGLFGRTEGGPMAAALERLRHKRDLEAPEMAEVMESVAGGLCSDDEIERFLLLLREKGETVEEITAAARVMRGHAVKLSREYPDLLDTCGTGADSSGTLNVSTLASLTAAAAGVKVAKHGNRSISSVSGSADLLEALGVKIDLEPAAVEACIEKTGFGFFFAPRFHPAMRHAAAARKRIQGKTLFNLLGPLCNPAGARRQVLGVYSHKLVEKIGRVLVTLGAKRALVVHGLGPDGMDEISLCERTMTAEVANGTTNVHFVAPEDFGLRRAPADAVRVATKEQALSAALGVLNGLEGPHSDIVCLNAGAALYTAERAASFREGVRLSKETLGSGAAMKKLREIAAQTQGTDGVRSS